MPSKYCPKCEKTMATTEFPVNRSRSDGLGGWCKSCTSDAVVIWKALHPEALRIHAQTWYEKSKAAQT